MLLRKIKRFILSGSLHSRPYLDYIKTIKSNSLDMAFVNFTVDLELAWCMSPRGNRSTTRREQERSGQYARAIFSEFMKLVEAYHIPVTFAVVGHLLLEECAYDHRGIPHADLKRFTPSWCPQGSFAYDPCTDIKQDPLWYGTDLVEMIMKSGVSHEIASHSFSHVCFNDEACDKDVASGEIAKSMELFHAFGVFPETFIFPKNMVGHLNIIKDFGFSIYRAQDGQEILKKNGMWEFPHGLWLSPLGYTVQEIKHIIDLSVENKGLVSFYFHLHEFLGQIKVLKNFLEPIFELIGRERERNRIQPATMKKIVGLVKDRVNS